jgi:general L-amino acid transport system substrate-binding protein
MARHGLFHAIVLALLAGAIPTAGGAADRSTTLERVIQAGKLRCGVVIAPEDWNKDDLHGDLSALDVEMCKAVGVAALGTRVHVELTPFNTEAEAEQGLDGSRVDLIVGVTPTASAAWRWHVAFGPPVFYDGLGVLVRSNVAAEKLADLAGRKLCVIDGTDNEHLIEAQIGAGTTRARVSTWQEEGEMDDAMATHWCDAVGAYVSRLVPLRRHYAQLAEARILPELLTLSPITPAYRQDDPQWGLLVDWTVHALVEAEALGIDQANVRTQAASANPAVQRLVGVDWAVARSVGLLPRKDWAAQVIAVVGNYGEIYERTLGEKSPRGIPRGINALWTRGGLMHPLPVE